MAASQRRRLILSATVASSTVALSLCLTKLVGWLYSDSLSLFAALMDSLLDVLVSVMNLLAAHYALRPADDDHRFGHTRMEDMAAIAQAGFMLTSALWIALEAGQRLFKPQPLDHSTAAIAAAGISVFLTLLLVLYQKHVLQQTESRIIEADSLHYVGDIALNGSVLLALLAQHYMGWLRTDSVLALCIAAYLVWNGLQLARKALERMMDKEMPDEEKQAIISLLQQDAELLGYHALKTRMAGSKRFIQLHAELPGHMSLWQAHEVVDRLEQQIAALFTEAEVIIHPDPREAA